MISAEETKALMAKDENGLLPCPFCGGDDLGVGAGMSWAVKCHDCFGRTQSHNSRQEAIAAWNTRAYIPAISTLQTLLNQAAEALKKLGGNEAFTVSFMANKNKEWAECVARMRFADQTLTAISPYMGMGKEGE